MKEILAIMQREIEARVYRRSFFIGSLIVPILLMVLVISPLAMFSQSKLKRGISVLDQSGDPTLFPAINERVQNSDLATKFGLAQVIVTPREDVNAAVRERRWQLRGNADLAIMVLPQQVLGGEQPQLYAGNVDDPSLIALSQMVGITITGRRLAKLGVTPAEFEQGMKNTELKMIRVTAEGETQPNRGALVLPLILFLLMYFGVARLGQSVMIGLLEEKQSKIVEVVISSVTPIQLMIGKLLGIGIAGLLQMTIWLVAVTAVRAVANPFMARTGGGLGTLSAGVMVAFFGYFIIGYFMFGTIYAILGAMVSRAEDLALFQRPLGIINLIPLLVLLLILRDPNGPASVTLSLIPLFSPTLMLLRTAIVPPPLWQTILSVVLILITMVAALWVAAKVYRVGILLYGKKLTFAQVGRWLKYS